MQALAGKVETDRGFVAVEIQVHPQVGAFGIHRRPHAEAIAQLIHDRVLHLERGVVRMVDRRLHRGAVHRERAVGRHVIAPDDLLHAGIQRLGRGGGKARQRQQHPARQPRPQAGAVGAGEIARKRRAGTGFLDRSGPESAQLVGQQRFQPLGAGGEKCLRGIHKIRRLGVRRQFK